MTAPCRWYVRRAGLIGACYAFAPSLLWYALVIGAGRYREVYLLRLAITLLAGGPIGALVHREGVSLWLIKHRSVKGPATLLDGILIGGGVSLGCALLPPLTSLIASTDMDYARGVILSSWVSAVLVGAIVGAALTYAGRRTVAREWPEDE